jgi:hypothetical protein
VPKEYEMPRRKDMATWLGCDHRRLRSIRAADGRTSHRGVSSFSVAWPLLACTVFASFCSRVVLMSLTI